MYSLSSTRVFFVVESSSIIMCDRPVLKLHVTFPIISRTVFITNYSVHSALKMCRLCIANKKAKLSLTKTVVKVSVHNRWKTLHLDIRNCIQHVDFPKYLTLTVSVTRSIN